VVLLLFLIGLELEPKRLWSMRRPIFGWGTAQVLGVAGALFGAALLAGVDWKVALVAALGLSLSSTAIALATLGERNLMGTPAGQAGFAILLFQDIAAIPMIAAGAGAGRGGGAGSGGGWLGRAARLGGVIAALVIGGRYLVRPALRIIAKSGMREIFTAFALLLVIAISLLMQWVGMSMALGAFMAGVLLADSEYRHALETDLEPFKGLLLGLFFIAVGMSVDFGVFLSQPLLILGWWPASWRSNWRAVRPVHRFGIARGQRWLFAFLLSQGGEFAFVVFGAAATARVFTPEVGSILVAVVALSMVPRRCCCSCTTRCSPRYRGQNQARAGRHRRQRRPRHHRRLRALRPDRRAPAERQPLQADGARPRPGPDRAAAPLRLQGVLRRRHPGRPAACGRRRQGARAGAGDRRHRGQPGAGRRRARAFPGPADHGAGAQRHPLCTS
jgi:glutathione-regulated potassium-efflux system ancillary protein KefC